MDNEHSISTSLGGAESRYVEAIFNNNYIGPPAAPNLARLIVHSERMALRCTKQAARWLQVADRSRRDLRRINGHTTGH